jgi:transcription antitermination factor NusG
VSRGIHLISCGANEWFAIQVLPRHEFSSAKILRGKGFDPFVPKFKSERIWSDRKIELELPLFPGYIFCRFDVRVRLPVMTTPGVIRIVGNGKTPIPVEEREIQAVQLIVQHECKAHPHSFIPIGTCVVVDEGPLSGLAGIVKGYKNRQLVISIGLIQQSISINVDDYALKIVKVS